MSTKIYCDIADYDQIKKYSRDSLVKGFTTNPSLMRKAGAKDYKKYAIKILSATKKPLSLEVFADDIKRITKQAYIINKWGKNIYVKIPVTTSNGKFTGKVIKELNCKKIKLNITAIYSFEQVKKIAKCIITPTPVIISIFAGRMADTGIDPLPIFKKSIALVKKKKNIQILWASTREPYNYLQAKHLKCNIITMPPKVIDQIKKFGKSPNQLTLETIRGFLKDSKSSKFSLK